MMFRKKNDEIAEWRATGERLTADEKKLVRKTVKSLHELKGNDADVDENTGVENPCKICLVVRKNAVEGTVHLCNEHWIQIFKQTTKGIIDDILKRGKAGIEGNILISGLPVYDDKDLDNDSKKAKKGERQL